MAHTKKFKLELVRSDLGDGGWSIHAQDEALSDSPLCDSQDAWPLLASGPSGSRGGEWLRPNRRDWAAARAAARRLAKTRSLVAE